MNGGRKKNGNWKNKEYTTDEPQIASATYVGQPPDEGLRAYLFDVSRSLEKRRTLYWSM